MALNNVWEDKQDGIDDILSKDINDIAHAVIEGEKGIEELKERVDGINVALKNVAAKYELVGVDINTVTDSGIYSIGSDCTGLPVDLGQTWCGKTLIVSANTAGDYYNQYLIANWYADENGEMTEYTRIYACYIYNPEGTPSYDMPWTLIYDTSKPQLMLDSTLTKEGAAADAKAVGDAFSGKADKVTIEYIGVDGINVFLAEMLTKTEIRLNDLYTGGIELVVPDEIEEDYISSIVFESFSPARTLTYTAEIQMSGTDCINGVFVPEENKRYTLYLEYDGKYVSGFVSGVSTV